MTDLNSNSFNMDEPREIGRPTRYAFWMTSSQERLFDVVANLRCVTSLKRTGPKRAHVHISDNYDADEAWHYIRTELHEESQYVHLDQIWEDALWL